MGTTWLYTAANGEPFAYTTDDKNYYRQGGGWWAWLSGTWLYSAQGGAPLGWFSGKWFYDTSGKPLYYMT